MYIQYIYIYTHTLEHIAAFIVLVHNSQWETYSLRLAPPQQANWFQIDANCVCLRVVVVGHFCHHFSVFTKAVFRGLVNFIIPDMMWVKQNSKTQKQFLQHRVVQNIFEIIWKYFWVSFAPGEETRDQSGLTRWIFVLSPKAKTVLMFKQRSWKHIWLKHRCGPVQRSQVALLALWQ